jgi:hypothetical protein
VTGKHGENSQLLRGIDREWGLELPRARRYQDRAAGCPLCATASSGAVIENRTFDEIAVGDRASIVRMLAPKDIEPFAVVSYDVNPTNFDSTYVETDLSIRTIVNGVSSGALISAAARQKSIIPTTCWQDSSPSWHAQLPRAWWLACVCR